MTARPSRLAAFVRAAASSAVFTARWALRGRYAAAVLALSALVVAVLPAQLRADGTAVERLRMIMGWTPSVAVALIGAATLWAGCASIPLEAEGKRFATARTSPAAPLAIFAGRWAGLVAVNAAILALVLAGTWLQAASRIPRGGDASSVRALLRPAPGALEEEAARIRKWAAPPESDPAREEAVMESIRRELRSDALLPVPPGVVRRWRFTLPRGGSAPGLRVAFRCLSPYGSTRGVQGRVEVFACGDDPVASLDTDPDTSSDTVLDVPDNALQGAETVEVRFTNLEKPGAGVSALVGWRESMRVSTPSGGHARNLLRAFPAYLAIIALLAALGTAAGCAFSFPVAAFVATAAVAMVLLSGADAYDPDAAPDEVVHVHSVSTEPTALDKTVEHLAEHMGGALRRVLAPLGGVSVSDSLGDGIAVDASAALRALALDGLALGAFFGLLGAAALRRREFA